jgi:hypothetical protein
MSITGKEVRTCRSLEVDGRSLLIILTYIKFKLTCIYGKLGRDSSVGITIRYGVDGPGIEARWGGETFHTRPDRPCVPPSLQYSGYRVFPRDKAAGVWR